MNMFDRFINYIKTYITKEKIITLIKNHKITFIIMIIYTLRIFYMYFSSKELPDFSQLIFVILVGNFFIAVFSFAYYKYKNKNDKTTINTPYTKHKSDNITYHKMFKVAGVTFNCKLDNNTSRQELLHNCSISTDIHLEQYTYKNQPAFMIILDDLKLDIGVVPENIIPTILKYKGRKTSIEFVEVSSFISEDSKKEIYYAKVKFVVYKN